MEESRPSIDEQKAIIKDNEIHSILSIESGAYAINKKWYNDWKLCVGYDSEKKDISLGPINNEVIYCQGNGLVRIEKQEGFDFGIVKKGVWENLYEWYGGGPEIKLEVFEDNGLLFAIPQKAKVCIRCTIDDEKSDFFYEVYHRLRVKKVIDIAMEHFKVPLGCNYQLVEIFHKKVRRIFDPTGTFQDSHLDDDQVFILDVEDDENGFKYNMYTRSESANVPLCALEKLLYPGKCGLQNVGNSCYFNSAVQCLVHSVPFIRNFFSRKWVDELNTDNSRGTNGKLVKVFVETSKFMWSGNYPYINPKELKDVMGLYAPQFSGVGQNDAHELLLFMLDLMHEDLNRCLKRQVVDTVRGDGHNNSFVAENAWRKHITCNDSIVVDTFHGLLKTELSCPNKDCNGKSVVYDPFSTLPLPLKMRKLVYNFVPWDPLENWRKISIMPNSLTFRELCGCASKEIGRDLIVLPAYVNMNKVLKWGNPQGDRDVLLLFEIPDKTKFYIPVTYSAKIKNENNGLVIEDFILNFFLIQVEDANFAQKYSEQDIAQKIRERIPALFDLEKEFSISEKARVLKEKVLILNNEEVKFLREEEEDFEDIYIGYSLSYTNQKEVPKKSSVIAICAEPPVIIRLLANFNINFVLKNYLTTPNKDDPVVPLSLCFRGFISVETLDSQNLWSCPHCKNKVAAEKRTEIWKVPECLIIHLERFSRNNRGTGLKDSTKVDYPEILDMKPYICKHDDEDDVKMLYKLYAVICHRGSHQSGHYTAFCKISKDGLEGQWCEFDDSKCTDCSESDAHTPLAYLLFYQHLKD